MNSADFLFLERMVRSLESYTQRDALLAFFHMFAFVNIEDFDIA